MREELKKIPGDVSEIKVDVKEVKADVKELHKVAEQLPETIKSQTPPEKSVPPTTTVEQDLRTAGQRQINLIWETTQRHIALFVIGVACLVSAYVVVFSLFTGKETNALVLAAFTLLSNIGFLIAGFYFGRTNHARIGDEPSRRSYGSLDDRM